MGLQINTNIAAMNAYRNLSGTQGSMSTSLERLSSGLRINRAADDAAGLAISEKLRSQSNGLNQATANAQDGISLIQTAEGALNESHSILQRMRQLAVQSANDTNTVEDRKAIQSEVTSLGDELTRLADATKFNGTALLNGGSAATTGLTFQIGANNGDSEKINVKFADMRTGGLGFVTTGAHGVTPAVTTGTSATETGAFTIGSATTTPADGIYTRSGTDIKLGVAVVGSYAAQTASFGTLGDGGTMLFTGAGLADGETFTVATTAAGPASTGTAVDVSDQLKASAAITQIDTAIGKVSSQRADLGAVQNRLQHVVNSLSVAAENASAAESRIRDTDMAKEMTAFTRSQILSQAGVSMLAQANSAPQSVLKLLG